MSNVEAISTYEATLVPVTVLSEYIILGDPPLPIVVYGIMSSGPVPTLSRQVYHVTLESKETNFLFISTNKGYSPIHILLFSGMRASDQLRELNNSAYYMKSAFKRGRAFLPAKNLHVTWMELYLESTRKYCSSYASIYPSFNIRRSRSERQGLTP